MGKQAKGQGKFWKFCSQAKGHILGNTIYQKLSRIYLAIILLGFGALNIPGVSVNQGSADWFSKLFISMSAFTTTGLAVSSPKCSLNVWGQVVLLILIQVGGIGVVTIWMFIKNAVFKWKKSDFEERMRLHSERGSTGEESAFEVTKTALKILLSFEIVFASILVFFFYFVEPKAGCTDKFKGNFLKSLWAGVFHAISALNNAGLDIISDTRSIAPYSKGWGVILTVIFSFASIIGGIGYPALCDLQAKFSGRGRNRTSKPVFSLFTKISLLMYTVITITAGTGVLLAEGLSRGFNGNGKDCCLNTAEKIWQLVYLVISSRSSGFAGLDISSLHEKTQWILLVLMFIGAAPASTGGGIRGVTLFVIVGKVWFTLRGRKALTVFSKTISETTVDSAFLVFIMSSMLIVAGSLFITGGGQQSGQTLDKHAALFEASSAFGTTGLSLGMTEKTRWFGKVTLMILMYLGQLGIPNVLMHYVRPKVLKKDMIYPEEQLRIA
ncbi:cation transport protein [Candidatus Mycoplasma haematolamae str. Purdue]|uniref:Cation transport protein n=1 Tax=Mycoplasma haematolamae (strain Purdue) TaxID=1212765 RepID=I7C6C6_MYCHA|nr:potassium transporter TrkG [Candidatus Mycoplasma haematolamae]AFO52052.1 cation transport protein [Candidatus Mycoplasma haematolamae str. Purdue]